MALPPQVLAMLKAKNGSPADLAEDKKAGEKPSIAEDAAEMKSKLSPKKKKALQAAAARRMSKKG